MATKTTKNTKSKTTKKVDEKTKKKKINAKVIAKATVDSQLTRAYQERYDARFQLIARKYNKIECPKCNYDINVVGITMFSDPKTNRQFIQFRQTCSSHCQNNDQIFEIIPREAEDLENDNIRIFNEYD